ncbi:MAG: hypothetical protein H6727_14615 [Myxococcales bacterium]|nr:hypothetical protein [Myxococcales bacterium]
MITLFSQRHRAPQKAHEDVSGTQRKRLYSGEQLLAKGHTEKENHFKGGQQPPTLQNNLLW